MKKVLSNKWIIVVAILLIAAVGTVMWRIAVAPKGDNLAATDDASLGNGSTEEPVWELVEMGKQYEIYYADNTLEYSYVIYNAQGNETYNSQTLEEYFKNLKIEYLSPNLMKLHTSTGTYMNLTWYYDAQKELMSQVYQNPYLEFDDNVVYYDGEYLIIENIFYGSDVEYRKIPCDFVTTFAPERIGVIIDGTMLLVDHLKSDGKTEITQIFEIKSDSKHVTAIHMSDTLDDIRYIIGRLPVVSEIGDLARTREINSQYIEIYNIGFDEVKYAYENPYSDPSDPYYMEYANSYFCEYGFSIVAETSEYISIEMYEEGYSGGAHGWHYVWIDNYDIKTGKKLTLEDFLGDIPNWQNKLERELKRLDEIRQKEDKGYYEVWSNQPMIADRDNTFFVENGNLHVLYNEYEIDSYAAGLIEFVIPISSL